MELRPLRKEDFHALWEVASDPLLWEQHPVKTRCQPQGFEAFFQESLESGGCLVILDRKGNRIIGSSRYHGFDPGESEIEIGWTFLARSHWGGAANGEVKRLMLAHAFHFVENVVFLIGHENYRSQRAVEKIGAVPVGSRADAGRRDSLVYRLTAAEFRLISTKEN